LNDDGADLIILGVLLITARKITIRPGALVSHLIGGLLYD